jgi:hypothetical protein
MLVVQKDSSMSVDKPLKLYGSISHLPNSRLGKTDHYITEGQAKIATQKARDKHDLVIVQEKLDGSCCGVLKQDGTLFALTRSGNLCRRSPYLHHHKFEDWMYKNYDLFDFLLNDGERIIGEGLWMAHGTKYNLNGRQPWVPFDIMQGHKRLRYIDFFERVKFHLPMPPLISLGPPRSIEWVQRECPCSRYGGEHVEGWIWRVERQGDVDFLCKYVKNEFEPGKYLTQELWNLEI